MQWLSDRESELDNFGLIFCDILTMMTTKPAFKTTLEKTLQSYRNGNHATVYDVRRDPELKNKNVIRDKNKKVFPFVSGSVYRGEWDNDQKCGFGTQTNPSGSKYDGEFAGNKYHGVGTLWVKRGNKSVKQYVGDWANGRKHGYGTFFYENGEVYKGYWENNKRSGKGQLDYPNGDCFIGEWENDAQKGYGTLLLHNGNVFEGLYRDGMKDGPGRFYYAATKKVSSLNILFQCYTMYEQEQKCKLISPFNV